MAWHLPCVRACAGAPVVIRHAAQQYRKAAHTVFTTAAHTLPHHHNNTRSAKNAPIAAHKAKLD